MLTHVSHITILVADQDAALAFYTEKLGLILHTDAMCGPFRWITLNPVNNKNFEIALMKAETSAQQAAVGKQTPELPMAIFSTDNCQHSYETLKARGVNFIQEPQQQPWGVEALFTDLYGTVFGLHQAI